MTTVQFGGVPPRGVRSADLPAGWVAPVTPLRDRVGAPDAPDVPVVIDADVERISMSALSRRGFSARELEQTLLDAQVGPDAAAAEVERLRRVGLLDDDRLAVELVERLRRRKGLGRSALVQALKQHKLAPESINRAIADIELFDETAQADRVAADRERSLRGLDAATAERRLSAFLQRRGYSGDLARGAARRALAPGAGADRAGSGGPVFE
ncbi:MAG: regulatory protein RecX [Microbacterium sp.]|nr:regulatory protein RecX [Microbacterium sp.]